MINKKGIGFYTLAVLLILLAILLIFLPFTSNLVAMLKKGGDVEACRLSVLAQSQIKLVGSSPVSLKCDRRQVKFYNNKIEINGKKDPKYDFKQLDGNVVNKVVAEELRLCWYMIGEGELNVFQQDVLRIKDLINKGDPVCLICSEISFDKGVGDRKFSGIVDFMKGNKIPSGNSYYFDYLIKTQQSQYLLWDTIPWSQYTPWGYGTTNKISDDYFESGKNYVAYFLAVKPDWLDEKTKAKTSAYYIGLGDRQKVTEDCRALVN